MAWEVRAAKAVAARRRAAAIKAATTVRKQKAKRRRAAEMASETRRKPSRKAQKTAKRSQDALAAWCKARGWRLVFLDAESGNPRTGIVDAVALRVKKGAPDTLQLWLIQLKGGGAGLTPGEVSRLKAATGKLEAQARFAFHSGDEVEWAQI